MPLTQSGIMPASKTGKDTMKYAYLMHNRRFQGRVEVPEDTAIVLFEGHAYLRHAFGTTWVFEEVPLYTVNHVESAAENDPKLRLIL